MLRYGIVYDGMLLYSIVYNIMIAGIPFVLTGQLKTNTPHALYSFLTHGYSVGVFVSYCHQPQNRRFLLFSSSLLCAPGAGRTGLECFVIGCFHNACKHRAFG
jgi:hypothetical protein